VLSNLIEETLKIFDENRHQIGEATRDDVHKNGYWHETFQCWLISIENDQAFIYFQIRSKIKKDFPNLLDITAAGHILSNETVEDGIREVKEELGIEVNFDEVISLGVVKNKIVLDDFIDNEFSHIFLLKSDQPFTDFKLQKSEVSGIVKSNFNDFYNFALGLKESIQVEGFEINDHDEKILINKIVSKEQFVSHEDEYLLKVVELLKEQL